MLCQRVDGTHAGGWWSLAWRLLCCRCVIQLPDSLQPPVVEEPLADVAFRLCRMMLARKVLWDEDIGFDVAQFAQALDTRPSVVRKVLQGLRAEGWIVLESEGERPVLTDRGLAAVLGRRESAAGMDGRRPLVTRHALLPSAQN